MKHHNFKHHIKNSFKIHQDVKIKSKALHLNIFMALEKIIILHRYAYDLIV